MNTENETSIIWTEHTLFPKGWSIKKHSHADYFHLFYFVSGTGTFYADRENRPIAPGSCFVMAPGEVHGLEEVTKGELTAYEIKFTVRPDALSADLGNCLERKDESGFIRLLIERIIKIGMLRDPVKSRLTNHLMCVLLDALIGTSADDKPKDSDLIDTSAYSEATSAILAYIEAHYMEHIYLDDIAGFIDYNRNYMCSLFKNDTGITTVDYLNYVRIRKACEYITYSDIALSQICSRVGFSNLSHFNRTFKKLVGTTPAAYSKLAAADETSVNENAVLPRFPDMASAFAALKV